MVHITCFGIQLQKSLASIITGDVDTFICEKGSAIEVGITNYSHQEIEIYSVTLGNVEVLPSSRKLLSARTIWVGTSVPLDVPDNSLVEVVVSYRTTAESPGITAYPQAWQNSDKWRKFRCNLQVTPFKHYELEPVSEEIFNLTKCKTVNQLLVNIDALLDKIKSLY